MCGYIGHISNKSVNFENLSKVNEFIKCRGPDRTLEKTIINENSSLKGCLIFNRLSIIDLSTSADQPMYSPHFKTTLLFNGEIYNHRELRKELEKEGLIFNTDHSDTEVVLLGLSHFGKKFIEKLIGQFSIVFYDEKNQYLLLVKDRVAQKPLFYKISGNDVVFSSNLQSLAKYCNESVSDDSILSYLNLGVVRSPNTLFKNIFKLKPAEMIEVNLRNFQYKKQNYWKLNEFIDNKKFSEGQFKSLLTNAIEIRQEADVPVANFLSGGLDSTYIIKNLSKSSNKINTYSIGFDNPAYDETYWQQMVVDKYKTNHMYEKIGSNLNIETIFNSIKAFDEPYSDPSSIPSYIISKNISKEYKVAISGDGGDELFGGYTRIVDAFTGSKKVDLSFLYKFYPSIFGSGLRMLRSSNDVKTYYHENFKDGKLMNLLKINNNTDFFELENNTIEDPKKYAMILDFSFYLSEMMMVKIDRTSMANSLEVRSPFVDHRLIEYILSCDLTFDNYLGKKIIKSELSHEFDNEFLNRKKQGFAFQLEDWIYDNLDMIESDIKNGEIIKEIDKNIIGKLSFIKSRVNGARIWKLYFLEKYLSFFRK